MRVILGGVRGTTFVSGPDVARYGGDTTSVLVEGRGGERVILDAGSGIRRLGERLMQAPLPMPVLLLMTHYHLDHLMGWPAFPLLYRPGVSVVVAAPRRNGRSARDAMEPLLAEPYWPLGLKDLRASVEFRAWREEGDVQPERFGGFEIRWCSVHHRGGCTAYRVDEAATGRAVVFATDLEWELSTASEREAFRRLCAQPTPADLLLLDGQFDRSHGDAYRGWGHSTWEDGVDIVRETRIRALIVMHHGPDRTDAQLDQVEQAVAKAYSAARLGSAGMEVEV